MWSADGRLVTYGDNQRKRDYARLSRESAGGGDVLNKIFCFVQKPKRPAGFGFERKPAYRLWRVHVGVAAWKVPPVCGQHDFIHFIWLDNSIFWYRERNKREAKQVGGQRVRQTGVVSFSTQEHFQFRFKVTTWTASTQNNNNSKQKVPLFDCPHKAYCAQTACTQTRPSDIFSTWRRYIWFAWSDRTIQTKILPVIVKSHRQVVATAGSVDDSCSCSSYSRSLTLRNPPWSALGSNTLAFSISAAS